MICEAWEGLTVDGKFPLLERLDGGRDRCIFLTVRQGISTAVIRLVVTDRADQDKYLAKWEAAKALSHPSLSHLMETGQSSIRGSDLVYVVMEKPDSFLSGIIPSKALPPARAKEILQTVVDALSYVHEKGFAHGSVKPSNILQVGDQWKLASDEVAGAGASVGLARELDTYDAPEVGTGKPTPAADVWSVGIIAIEAFARKTPMWDRAAKGNLGVPEWLPEPFREIARGCLRWEPDQRISIAEIKALLERSTSLLEVEPRQAIRDVVGVKSASLASPAAAERPPAAEARWTDRKREEEKPATVRTHVEEEEDDEEEYEDEYDDEGIDELITRTRPSTLEKERKGVGRIIFIGIILLVIAAAVMAARGYWSEFLRTAANQIAPQASPPSPSPQAQAPADQTASGNPAPSSPNQTGTHGQPQAAPESQKTTPAENPAQNQPPAETQSVPSVSQPAPETQTPSIETPSQAEKQQPAKPPKSEQNRREETPAPRVTNARGVVSQRVLPSVAQGAKESMRRPVEVELQVSVNENGSVSNAVCLTQGPGNYFAKISRQAAESWKFQPPVSSGQPQPSQWTLRFHYDRSHVEVTATEVR